MSPYLTRWCLALAVLVLCCAPPLARAGCENAGSDAVLGACLNQELRSQDQRINQIYQRLMKALPEAKRESLRAQQRQWLKQRDLKCRLDSKERNRERWFQEIARDNAKNVCVIRFTGERLALLESMGPEGNADKHALRPDADAPLGQQDDNNVDPYAATSSTLYAKGKYYFEIGLDQAAIAEHGDASLFIGLNDPANGVGIGPLVYARHGEPPIIQLGQGRFLVGSVGYQIIGIAADLDNGKLYYSRNGDWVNGQPGSNEGLDVRLGRAYRGGVLSSVRLAPLLDRGLVKINFGADAFRHHLPPGYLAMEHPTSSQALPPSSLDQPESIVPPHAVVEGASLGEWASRYWRWRLQMAPEQDPGRDLTGERCGVGQPNGVWFLAGVYGGGTARRTCNLPSGRHVLVSIVSIAPHAPAKQGELCRRPRSTANAYINGTSGLFMTLDGKEIEGLPAHRESSPECFEFTGADGEKYAPAFAEGFWVMLKPLSTGEHSLHFGGRVEAAQFGQDVTYRLIVE